MKKVVALLALALAAVALVACGGDDDEDTTTNGATTEAPAEAGGAAGQEGGAAGGGSTFKVAAVPDTGLAYTTDQATVKAGNLTIDFENPQTLTHDVAIEDDQGNEVGKTELIAEGSTTAQVGNVKPGEYTFYCTVPGHREGGMEGTLTVK
jgi:plastocyanin